MTLAMARLLVGYESSRRGAPALRRRARGDGAGHLAVSRRGLHPRDSMTAAPQRRRVHALSRDPQRALPGALPARPSAWKAGCRSSTRIVHFTGYEIKLNQIQLADPRDRKLGHLLGHGGSDRADGGPMLSGEMPRPAVSRSSCWAALPPRPAATARCRCATARAWTCCGRRRVSCARRARSAPGRANSSMRTGAWSRLFGGKNPYIEAIDRNLDYLQRVLRAERWRHAAAKPAAVHLRGKSARSGARVDGEPPEGALGLIRSGLQGQSMLAT